MDIGTGVGLLLWASRRTNRRVLPLRAGAIAAVAASIRSSGAIAVSTPKPSGTQPVVRGGAGNARRAWVATSMTFSVRHASYPTGVRGKPEVASSIRQPEPYATRRASLAN